mmetsp:Transcript_8732/g.29142  ORF Transcript_8732/g.29142 Transcript_8732/m.29142 type:complete len:233 (-) Transcript_8732:136-834(-)
MNGDNFPLRNFESDRVRISGIESSLHLRRVCISPSAIIRHLAPVLLSCFPLLFQLLLSAEAWVSEPHVPQLLCHLHVNVVALRLSVKVGRPPDVGTLVPVQAEPLEVRDHAVLALLGASCKVRILDAQHELSSELLCHQVVVQSSPRPSDVQRSSWGWRESQPGYITMHSVDAKFLEHINSRRRHLQALQPSSLPLTPQPESHGTAGRKLLNRRLGAEEGEASRGSPEGQRG